MIQVWDDFWILDDLLKNGYKKPEQVAAPPAEAKPTKEYMQQVNSPWSRISIFRPSSLYLRKNQVWGQKKDTKKKEKPKKEEEIVLHDDELSI